MQAETDLSQVKELVDRSHNVLLITNDGNNNDVRIAQHIMYEAFAEKGKKVFLSPTEGEYPGLPDRSVTLRFAYDGVKIERLQYRIRDDEVELTFNPFTGTLNRDQMVITYPTFEPDVVITIGIGDMGDMPAEIRAYNIDFDALSTVSLDNRGDNRQWAKYSVNISDIPVYSLLAIYVVQQLGMPVRGYWIQKVLTETKQELPQVGNASSRLLRLVADLLEQQ